MSPDECRSLFSSAPVARLGTAGVAGPHVVPIVFAIAGDRIVTAVDHKPKRTTHLQRLENIAANPVVAVLADHYEDDWARLWWVRADGAATVVEDGSPHESAVGLLAEKYPQYREHPVVGPVIDIRVDRWSGWKPS